jgi:hypothetical protein
MPHAKWAAALGVAALVLCGCGSVVKPSQGRGRVEDPRTGAYSNYYKCIVNQRLPAQKVGRVGIQIGALPGGPTVEFLPTPSAAQAAQIQGQGQYEPAEVIGAALLYPHSGTDPELARIESCLASGVQS